MTAPADRESAPAADVTETNPFTLGQLYARVAALPPDTRVVAMSFEPCFFIVEDNGIARAVRSVPHRPHGDRFQGAAAIIVQHSMPSGSDAIVTASDAARDIEPLIAQHAHKPLITNCYGDVADLVVAHMLETPDRRSVTDKMAPHMSSRYKMAIDAAKALATVERVGNPELHTAIEALLPEGLCVELYRLGDRIYTVRTLLARFPDLLVSQAREIFTRVAETEPTAAAERHGTLVLRVAPDDITEAMVDALFGGKTPLIDRLRSMALGAPTQSHP
nr:hypothetical protein [Pandoravirus massiliensis]